MFQVNVYDSGRSTSFLAHRVGRFPHYARSCRHNLIPLSFTICTWDGKIWPASVEVQVGMRERQTVVGRELGRPMDLNLAGGSVDINGTRKARCLI